MKIFNRERYSGKTTALVEIMLQPGNEDVVFVAPTNAQAERLGLGTALKVFNAVNTPELRRRFISANELKDRKGFKGRYVIDEVDAVLRVLLGSDVVAIAGTDEDHDIAYRVKRGVFW